jgi:hypothetical protein
MSVNKYVLWGGIFALGYWLGSKGALGPAITGVRGSIGRTVETLSIPATEPDRAELGPA